MSVRLMNIHRKLPKGLGLGVLCKQISRYICKGHTSSSTDNEEDSERFAARSAADAALLWGRERGL